MGDTPTRCELDTHTERVSSHGMAHETLDLQTNEHQVIAHYRRTGRHDVQAIKHCHGHTVRCAAHTSNTMSHSEIHCSSEATAVDLFTRIVFSLKKTDTLPWFMEVME